jgi:hypothetical protein
MRAESCVGVEGEDDCPLEEERIERSWNNHQMSLAPKKAITPPFLLLTTVGIMPHRSNSLPTLASAADSHVGGICQANLVETQTSQS